MLTLVSALYASVVRVRNRAYDCGIARSVKLPIPVISVGNITAGGTGKTPIVEYILSLQPSARPVVLSRGYRRDSRGTLVVSDGQGCIADAAAGGDEPVQIAANAPTVPVIVDAKRRRSAHLAMEQFDADLLLLDDAFQHRSLRRDLDIVVYDASVFPSRQRMLPRGRLREPLEGLRRASVLLLTRCRDSAHAAAVERELRVFSEAPMFATQFLPVETRTLSGDTMPSQELAGTQVGAFCGIGNPVSFAHTLELMETRVHWMEEFPDHHRYTEIEVAALMRRAEDSGVGALLTTEKDAMRLRLLPAMESPIPVVYPKMALRFLEGEEEFVAMLRAIVRDHRLH
jgi:tetraacyldisaccharide 4'-kinase